MAQIELTVRLMAQGDRAALIRADGQPEPVEVPLALVDLSAIGRGYYRLAMDRDNAVRFGLVPAVGAA